MCTAYRLPCRYLQYTLDTIFRPRDYIVPLNPTIYRVCGKPNRSGREGCRGGCIYQFRDRFGATRKSKKQVGKLRIG
ncbi:protein of unknown function [Methylocaldum szegediense]|uniref:Transposase n=1 Tax=Methylocaldum szegediense TaxID=73780 RepID=A0ABM9HWY0_9GAMM|nr:protein of unknown function [Methylocaldum szegediense]